MSSNAEVKFLSLWRQMFPSVELTEEYRFHPTRKWRFDFCHEASHTAIEIEGGVWSGGRHTRGYGYRGDLDKYNNASFLGWVVIRLSPDMITESNLSAVHSLIDLRNGSPQQAIELPLVESKPNARKRSRTPQVES